MDFSLEDLGIHKRDIRFINSENNNSFIQKYQSGELNTTNFKELKELINEIYQEVRTDNQGKVADYIPQLKNVDSELFGISLVTVDGQVIQLGDYKSRFCIQSCSKPITYGIALDKYEEKYVHNFVGKEPSGRNFNELCLNEEGLPHNPLINSGAIMMTSLINPEQHISERFTNVFKYWEDFTCGNYLSFNNSVYLSERDTADRNYCLGYMMQEKGAFLGSKSDLSKKFNRNWDSNDLKKNLELYFQFCSIECDLLGAGLLASTLANSGVHPWSNKLIHKPETVKKILSIMSTCGMYDYSGEWYYEIGIPAKSGVSGLIYAVIPGLCGIATYSPKLDKLGNSYRGIQFFSKLVKKLNIHKYNTKNDSSLLTISKLDNKNDKILGYLLLDGCSNNNIDLVKECLSKGCDVNFQDYDKRTGLHLAVEDNNLKIVELLMSYGAKEDLEDRWGKTAKTLKNNKFENNKISDNLSNHA